MSDLISREAAIAVVVSASVFPERVSVREAASIVFALHEVEKALRALPPAQDAAPAVWQRQNDHGLIEALLQQMHDAYCMGKGRNPGKYMTRYSTALEAVREARGILAYSDATADLSPPVPPFDKPSQPAAPAVKVKPLVWGLCQASRYPGHHEEFYRSSNGDYEIAWSIYKGSPLFQTYRAKIRISDSDTLEGAQAAAETDHQARIRAELEYSDAPAEET